MPTQHRPSKEPDRPKKGPVSLLERLYRSIQHGNIEKMEGFLEELAKDPPPGLWAHRALALALEGKHAEKIVPVLLASPVAPVPTGRSDFIHIAIKHHKRELLPLLFKAGFLPLRRGARGLLEQLRWYDEARWPGVCGWRNLLRAEHLRPANDYEIVDACVRALAANASPKWLRVLAEALPQPTPAEAITRSLIEHMAHSDKETGGVTRKTMERAVALWWVDLNIAKDQADKLLARLPHTVLSRYQAKYERDIQNALVLLAHQELGEETTPPAAPIKRPTSRL